MSRHGRPVLATPAAPAELRLAGLMRFQTHTGRRMMFRRVMRVMMRLGLDHWFSEATSTPIDPADGFDFNAWLDQVRRDLGNPDITATIIWPSEPRRKRVYVHLFDGAANAVGFAKVAMNEENDQRLEHEALMLSDLTSRGLRLSHVPRVLADHVWQGHRYLIIEPVPDRAEAPSGAAAREFPRQTAEEFVGPTRSLNADDLPTLSWWPRYERRRVPEGAAFDQELRTLAADGVRVRFQHGDFGRHNMVFVDGSRWIFDWEEACDDAPAATDELSYWTTAHLRGFMSSPLRHARMFYDKFVRGANAERRCDIMMAIAFRYSMGMSSAAAIVRHWGAAAGASPEAPQASTYRQVFAPTAKAQEYEESMCQSGGYAEVLWRTEQEQLAGVIADLRRTHPRIESLDFAAGTGRITRFVETRVDSSTAIEISPAMIEVARQKVRNTTILCKDVTAPDADVEAKYDLITAFRFVVNAEPSLRLAGLRALAARLRDQSSVLVFNNHGNLISQKIFLWPIHRWKRRKMTWSPDGNYMTDGDVRDLADRAGLKVERVMGCGLLGGRGASILGFERAVRWERALAARWPSAFGGNQMYITRLKPEAAAPGPPPPVVEKREAHRAAVRIVTNYARLGVNLALGLTFVPFVLHWVGNEAMGLIILLGAGVGLPAMFREITVRSVIRELGAAYHSGDSPHFRRIFNASLAISAGMACVAAALFVVLYFCLPLLSIPPGLLGAAHVMMVSQAVYICTTTALSPIFNMLVVTEKFVQYNLWVLAERSTMLLTAVFVHMVLGVNSPGPALSEWSIIVAGLQCLVFLLPVAMIMASDPRLRPAPSCATRESVKTVGKTLGLYVAVESASAMYEKVGQLIVNLFFGLSGNTIFGVAYQFVSYVRQATVGVTFGLDAVSARLSSSGTKPLQALMHHSTRLHGLVAIPVGTAVFLIAEPLIRAWVGGRLTDPEKYLPGIVLTVQIMSISMTARAIAEGWTTILYGAGFLRRYAPLVLTGGIIFPPLAISLLRLMGAPGNDSITLFIVPGTFGAMHFTIYLLILPWIAARCIGVSYAAMFLPLWRPVLITSIAGAVMALLLPVLADVPTRPGLIALGAAGAIFGTVYTVLAYGLVLSAEERERFVLGPLRRWRTGIRTQPTA